MKKVDWFSRGRDAMTEGKPCFFKDARTSNADRKAWYAGWHHQARLNSRNKITDEDRSEAIAGLQDILDTLKKLP